MHVHLIRKSILIDLSYHTSLFAKILPSSSSHFPSITLFSFCLPPSLSHFHSLFLSLSLYLALSLSLSLSLSLYHSLSLSISLFLYLTLSLSYSHFLSYSPSSFNFLDMTCQRSWLSRHWLGGASRCSWRHEHVHTQSRSHSEVILWLFSFFQQLSEVFTLWLFFHWFLQILFYMIALIFNRSRYSCCIAFLFLSSFSLFC